MNIYDNRLIISGNLFVRGQIHCQIAERKNNLNFTRQNLSSTFHQQLMKFSALFFPAVFINSLWFFQHFSSTAYEISSTFLSSPFHLQRMKFSALFQRFSSTAYEVIPRCSKTHHFRLRKISHIRKLRKKLRDNASSSSWTKVKLC